MKDMKYFSDNAMYAIEVEDAGGCGRYWDTVKGSDELARYIRRVEAGGNLISDVDYAAKQEDEWCRKVLNLTDYNWDKNKDWCRKMGFKSFGDLIIWIVENKRA